MGLIKTYRVQKEALARAVRAEELMRFYVNKSRTMVQQGLNERLLPVKEKIAEYGPKAVEYYRKAGRNDLADRVREVYMKYRPSPHMRINAVASILSLLGALFFISLNLTGNAVSAGITESSSKIVSLLLFACGLVFALLHFKKGKF